MLSQWEIKVGFFKTYVLLLLLYKIVEVKISYLWLTLIYA